MHRFDSRRAEGGTCRRQMAASTNLRTRRDFNDFPRWLGWIERHGVPNVQESVWTQLRKTIAVAIGMPR